MEYVRGRDPGGNKRLAVGPVIHIEQDARRNFDGAFCSVDVGTRSKREGEEGTGNKLKRSS